MPVTANSLITAQAVAVGIATLTSPSAITTRTNITGTTGLVQLTPTSTNGKRVDFIRSQAKGTTAAGLLFLWLYNGTTSFLIDEIVVSAITPNTTQVGFKLDTSYLSLGSINLPPTYQLFVSSTVTQDFNITAHGGDY